MSTFFDDIDRANAIFQGQDETPEYVVTRDILYADDTILLGSNTEQMQQYLNNVVSYGKMYGLQINWSKTKLLSIRTNGVIFDDTGNQLPISEQAIYLGALIRADGSSSKEISRRIGEA
eukprot:9205418-Karenia_brevis.AAC.1